MTTWHNVNGRMTQVIFKRPYYKGGSFPYGQCKGLGHILPWPCLGSERGKGRRESPNPFPTFLTTRSLHPRSDSRRSNWTDCSAFWARAVLPQDSAAVPSTEVQTTSLWEAEMLPHGSAQAWPQGCARIHTAHMPSCCLGPLLTFRSHFSNGMAGREQSSQGNYPVK